MDMEHTTYCCSCLSHGRKMVNLTERRKKECFMRIVNEISVLQAEDLLPIWLCWHCYAQITRFSKFTEQVKYSYSIFKEYSTQHKQILTVHHNSTPLTSHKLYNINIQDRDNIEFLNETIDIIKTENHRQPSPDLSIKEEYDNVDTNSDDEKLIDISIKLAKVKKKKRKKEIVIYKEIQLTVEELAEERREAQLNEDFVNEMFRCERCIMSFPNADDLKDHISVKHELNTQFKCATCECTFSTEVSYNYHTNKHTRRYRCVVCRYTHKSKRGVVKHFDQTHYYGPPIDFEIQNTSLENGTTTQSEEVKDESKVLQSSASFSCEVCDKRFRWKTSLRKHSETHRIEAGQKRRPYCEPCRLSFRTTSNLQKHVKTSSKHQIQLKLRKLTASLPPESTTPEKHQAHIDEIRSSVNNSRLKYPCPQCDKKFQWRGNLLRHVNSHVARASGELVCKECDRTFSSVATYNQHMNMSKKHVEESQFKYMCSECDKRFANKTRLKDHVDWEHLKNFVHKCQLCDKVFKSHTSLYLHRQVVHKKFNSEHLCHHCGKPFPNQAKLRSHISALHAGEAAYTCAECGARFSWHSCLSRHIRRTHRPTHTDVL